VWRVLFTEAARAELIEAQDWYEAEASGLGRRFRAEIETVVQRMADNPGNSPSSIKLSGGHTRGNSPTRSFFSSSPTLSWSSPAFTAAATRVTGNGALELGYF